MKNGFQLIELLITLSIISILAMCALPLYSQHIIKEKRLTAATALSQLAVALEQYHLERNTFADATLDQLHLPNYVANYAYKLNIDLADESSYLISAQPIEKQAEDVTCGTLKLSSEGKKSVTGTNSVSDCW